jgi:MFS family permease
MSLFAAGGSVGFFLAPALLTPALVSQGVSATVWFLPPAVLMGVILYRHQLRRAGVAASARTAVGDDRWGPFLLLTAVSVFRSMVFTGMNTFIGLYWITHLAGSQTSAGVALTAFLIGGVVGALLGGRMADRVGAVRAVQFGSLAAIPALIALRFVPNPVWALPLAAVAGAMVNMPFGVIVKLGQDYLPSRPGTAAGVTLGLSVSAGGMFLPVLGAVGDRLGPDSVLTALCAVPVAAFVLGTSLTAITVDAARNPPCPKLLIMNFGGKVALITGATRGIGEVTATLLARHGAHVLVSGRDQQRGSRVVEIIRAAGGSADFLSAALVDAQGCRALAAAASEFAGRVDILINNAAVGTFGRTEKIAETDFDYCYAVNVKAPFYLVGALAPAMAARGDGVIVNVSTMVASFGTAGSAVYAPVRPR